MGITAGMQSQTTGIRNIDWKQYISIFLPQPSLPEQNRISTLLTQDNSNRTLFIDEIERSSHPHVVRRIIEDFQSANQGNKAQLVFTSFLGSLMDEVLKRDEVYFVEKDDFGLTHLRSLSEYSSSNRRESIQKRYYEGRFGALPKLSVRIKDHATD